MIQGTLFDVTEKINYKSLVEKIEKINNSNWGNKFFEELLKSDVNSKNKWNLIRTKKIVYLHLKSKGNQILPTITASFGERGGRLNPDSNHDTEKALKKDLPIFLSKILLPTPVKSDYQPRWKTENWKGCDLPCVINEIFETRASLSVEFVAEMMGFYENWTYFPFKK